MCTGPAPQRVGLPLGPIDEVDKSRTKTLPVANHPKFDVLLVQLANVVFKETAKQAEQPVDFGFRAAPVFKGKGKGGKPADVTFARVACSKLCWPRRSLPAPPPRGHGLRTATSLRLRISLGLTSSALAQKPLISATMA